VTTLYLQRIEISNFRAYGDNFSLSLPGTGVTILTGPDGLGKSTLFEAIEWALTGRVRRLEALTQEKLDRGRNNGLLARRQEDVPVAQYGVSLEFVNGEGESTRIERRAVREQENREQFAEVSSPNQLRGLGRGLPSEVITEKAIAIAAALKTTFGVEFVLEGAPPPAVMLERLLQAIEQVATVLMARKRVLSQTEETLNAWQQLDSTAAEARAQHAAAQAALVGLQNQVQAVLEVDERRRGAEIKRDTLLRLSGARMKIAQGLTQKSSVAVRIDRHTHELWMIQSYLRDTTKTIQRIKDLDSRIRSLLLVKQAVETCQQAYDEWGKEDEELRSKEPERLADPTEQASHRARQEAIQSSPMLIGVDWGQIPSHLAESNRRTQLELEAAQATRDELPDLEYLNDHQASMKARIDQLSSTIKEEHEVVAQIEEELLAAHALQQQYPDLLSTLGTLPSDEANAMDEAVRAVEQLVHHERQLVQSEEPFPSVLFKLNEEITKAQATSAQKDSEAQNLEQQIVSLRQRLLELGLQGFPGPVALDDQRNKLAEQESELQQLREQQKRLADSWLAWQKEEELRQVELEFNEQARRECPPSLDAVEERLRTSLTTGVDNGVARLLSMSTAYRWSRWPALLLDDPLQHHDQIHAAAFIEVLRHLVRDRKYQVILSIQDEDLADSLRRKMEVVGIECVTCRYRGLGPTGVLYSTG